MTDHSSVTTYLSQKSGLARFQGLTVSNDLRVCSSSRGFRWKGRLGDRKVQVVEVQSVNFWFLFLLNLFLDSLCNLKKPEKR